jgi:transcriptional antiterminator NusG
MVYNDDVWHVVKNTQGVTGFVGPESVPIPLTDAEIQSLGIGEEIVSTVVEDADFVEGDNIVVISGPYIGTQGVIKSINHSKKTIRFSADNIIGGASTLVEIGFNAVKVERF